MIWESIGFYYIMASWHGFIFTVASIEANKNKNTTTAEILDEIEKDVIR